MASPVINRRPSCCALCDGNPTMNVCLLRWTRHYAHLIERSWNPGTSTWSFSSLLLLASRRCNVDYTEEFPWMCVNSIQQANPSPGPSLPCARVRWTLSNPTTTWVKKVHERSSPSTVIRAKISVSIRSSHVPIWFCSSPALACMSPNVWRNEVISTGSSWKKLIHHGRTCKWCSTLLFRQLEWVNETSSNECLFSIWSSPSVFHACSPRWKSQWHSIRTRPSFQTIRRRNHWNTWSADIPLRWVSISNFNQCQMTICDWSFSMPLWKSNVPNSGYTMPRSHRKGRWFSPTHCTRTAHWKSCMWMTTTFVIAVFTILRELWPSITPRWKNCTWLAMVSRVGEHSTLLIC